MITTNGDDGADGNLNVQMTEPNTVTENIISPDAIKEKCKKSKHYQNARGTLPLQTMN